MKTKLISLLILVLTVSYFDLSGQCVSCVNNITDLNSNASAIGQNNTATGWASFAVGSDSKAIGDFSTAIGIRAESVADISFAIGRNVKTGAGYSFAIGTGYVSSNEYLINYSHNTFVMGFNSTKPTFFVGESPSNDSKHDRTGLIGIGNMIGPQSKLHIYSDDDEPATLFLQPSNWTTEFNAQLWLGNQNHGISADVDKGLVFDTENYFVFNNGYLGLGTNEPTALLDVNGNARIRSLAGNGERNIVVDSAGNLSATAFTGQCTNCDQSTNNGTNSSAIGISTKALGIASFASGTFSEASGSTSTAMGMRNKATNDNSVAFGSFLHTYAAGAVTIGSGYSIGNELVNNEDHSIMFATGSTVPSLFVEVSKDKFSTGKIGIGNITAPEAKLHIYSDDDESATLFLQPTIWGGDYNAQIWLGNQNHGISAELDEGLVFETENSFVFRNGDIYLEDIDKGIIMKSPDGRCWRGVLDNNGSLNFTALETCPNGPDAIPEQGSLNNDNGLKVYPNPTNEYLTIELEENITSLTTVSLLDEKGVELISKQIKSKNTRIYTGDLSPGIYFLSVTIDGKQLVEKVIKQ